MRPLSVRLIESALLTAWPALKTAYDGTWLWRYANGYSKRVNSINFLDANDGEHADYRLARFTELSVQSGIAPVARITPLTPTDVLKVLDQQGWTELDPSMVMAMELPAADFEVAHPVKLLDPWDPAWFRAASHMGGQAADSISAFTAILEHIGCVSQGVLIYHKAGLPVASALVGLSNGVAVIGAVASHPSARGKGFGRAAVAAALNYSRAQGARHAALAVVADNTPAIGLYQSFGFGDVYDYAYRVAPDRSRS
jgi:ribosomal protein S18 acetylase RimI-like enzyme